MGSNDRAIEDGSAILADINNRVSDCRKCPRLVEWREQIAKEKRASFREDDYWGRAVPSFGDQGARVFVLGLAPAAHGANRTGRMFTGDRSGEWLYRALHRGGFANQPQSTDREDGLVLAGAYVSAAVRCAPPANRPSTEERDACLPFLVEELNVMIRRHPVVVCLGGFSFTIALRTLGGLGYAVPRPRPVFGHGKEVALHAEGASSERTPVVVLGSYHPSQQNTFTGRLTEPMFDAIWTRAAELVRTAS